MRILLLLALQCFTSILLCQSSNLFTNAKVIDEWRYEGIRDSPYQFDSWLPATIYTTQGDAIEVEELNINGYSKEIEIRTGNKFIELDQTSYSRIEINIDGGPKHTFVRNFENNFRTRFMELVHNGDKIKCVRQLEVPMIDIEMQNVGKTEILKRFNPKFTYIFLRDGQLDEVKIKEKQLLEYLGHKKELGKVLNKGKLKSNRLNHLKEILEHYETL